MTAELNAEVCMYVCMYSHVSVSVSVAFAFNVYTCLCVAICVYICVCVCSVLLVAGRLSALLFTHVQGCMCVSVSVSVLKVADVRFSWQYMEEVKKMIPLGRLGYASEVAGMCAFLALDPGKERESDREKESRVTGVSARE